MLLKEEMEQEISNLEAQIENLETKYINEIKETKELFSKQKTELENIIQILEQDRDEQEIALKEQEAMFENLLIEEKKKGLEEMNINYKEQIAMLSTNISKIEESILELKKHN